MAGRRQFETVVASAPRQSLVITQMSQTINNLSIGGVASLDLNAPSGFVGRVQSMFISATSPVSLGATSGTQVFNLVSNPSGGAAIDATYAHDKVASFTRFSWANGPTSQNPSDGAALAISLKDFPFDSVTSFRLNYINNTNTTLNNLLITWYVTWIKIESA